MSPPTSALLSANEIFLAYGYQRLLEGVTLSVSPGEKVGLVGRNGCGKTSLLKILAGAKNTDALSDRCRICGGLLPDAARRRSAALGAATAGPAFAEIVESEVTAWREFAEGRRGHRRVT